MPNWCDNQISITGPNSVIDKIEKIGKVEELDGLVFIIYQKSLKRIGKVQTIGKKSLNLLD